MFLISLETGNQARWLDSVRNLVQILKSECNPFSFEPVLSFFNACYVSPNYSTKQKEKTREEMPLLTERRQDVQKVADDNKEYGILTRGSMTSFHTYKCQEICLAKFILLILITGKKRNISKYHPPSRGNIVLLYSQLDNAFDQDRSHPIMHNRTSFLLNG